MSLDHIEDANDIVRDGSLRRERLLVKFLVESLECSLVCVIQEVTKVKLSSAN